MPDLYDAVGHGMWAYSHAAFRMKTLGRDRFRLEPGTVILATHRRESDVPILSPALYFGGSLRRNVGDRMSFAARDDMFLPGFFAGFPNGLPGWARSALYGISVARWLPLVQVYPLRSASVARLDEVLRARSDAQLDELLPDDLVGELRERAARSRLPSPERARDVLRGQYADLLWRAVEPADLRRDTLADFWSGRAAAAARDFRTLVDLLRSGGTLVVFPEGRPSPDGEIGPLRPGVGALVRRGRPRWIRPLALAYDPLVRGRTRVWVALPDPVAPPVDDVEPALLDLMRGSMPLTAGQYAAHRLVEGAQADPVALERGLAEAVEAAAGEGRLVEPDLLSPRTRARRLSEALAVAPTKPGALTYLAREYESARKR